MKRPVQNRRLHRCGICLLIPMLMIGAIALPGCTRVNYTVDYGGQKSSFRGAKDSYRAGQTVKLWYTEVDTDTDYTFLLDGEDLSCTYHRNKGFSVRFAMPEHDVTLRCVAQRNMIRDAEIPTEPDETATETEWDTTSAAPQTEPETAMPTTQTTTAPATQTAAPAPNGAYDFTVQYIHTYSEPENTGFPRAFCVTDRAALDRYLTGQNDLVRASDDTLQNYDDAWFASHMLVIAVLEEGSGSVRHTVTRVEKTAPHTGTVEIKRDVPEVGTCDMAYWHILIGLPAGTFDAADTIKVVMQ